jgi:hypothetical protein
MSKKIPTGVKMFTSWIPEQYAHVGKVLKFRDDEGVWDDGWIVGQASQTRLAQDMLPDYHSEIKGHRKATGDALPKNK